MWILPCLAGWGAQTLSIDQSGWIGMRRAASRTVRKTVPALFTHHSRPALSRSTPR